MTTTTIQVSVTQSDIDAARYGVKHPSQSCPIARAIRRHYPKAYIPSALWVQLQYAPSADIAANLPVTAQTFIRAFDAGEPVEPLVFELEVPA